MPRGRRQVKNKELRTGNVPVKPYYSEKTINAKGDWATEGNILKDTRMSCFGYVSGSLTNVAVMRVFLFTDLKVYHVPMGRVFGVTELTYLQLVGWL